MSEGGTAFGTLLRQVRTAAALSQEELAERSGLSRRGISDLERGRSHAPRLETVRMLADALALGTADRTALLAAARPALLKHDVGAVTRCSRGSLPVPLTRLIGRDAEIAMLGDLLLRPDVRLLTVTGSGGTGKTRLAVALATAVRDRYPDGVIFVDLTPLTDPTLVLLSIAAALGVRESAEQPLLALLTQVLASKHLLLVLDNFERVLEAAPDILTLLAESPGLRVLATSRQRLHVRGEQAFPLSPLLLPPADRLPALAELARVPAVALFVDRAQAVQPEFTLTAEIAPAVAQICARLDGIPLAIELAAARAKVLPPPALLSRLEPRLPLLAGGDRDLPDRQRTMWDAIAWSYDLLSPEEQHLFSRLTVFAGGFTLTAAATVAAPTNGLSVLDGVGALVEQNLLHPAASTADEPRYRMLETVREFGLEQLTRSGEVDEARQRHAAHFLELAVSFMRAYGSPVLMNQDSLAQVLAEQDNLRLALAWLDERGEIDALLELSSMLYGLWLARGLYREGLRWFERGFERSRQTISVARAKALGGAALLGIFQGDYDRAEPLLAESLALAKALDDPALKSEALSNSAFLAYRRGDHARAQALATEALPFLYERGDSWSAPLLILGDTSMVQEQFDQAARYYQDAIDRFQEAPRFVALGKRGDLSDAEAGLAGAQYCTGDLGGAATHYRASLEGAWDLGFPIHVASALLGLAAVIASAGHPEAGAHLLGAADGMAATLGAPQFPRDTPVLARGLAAMRSSLAEVHLAAARQAGRTMNGEQVIAEARRMAETVTASATAGRE